MVQNPGKEMFLLQKLAERGVRRLIPPGLKKKRENRIIMVIEAVGGGNMKLMRFIRILKKYSLLKTTTKIEQRINAPLRGIRVG